MKTSPVREAADERRAIPPLGQSRRSDMACETRYVPKHVQRATVAESGAAARGIEIHRMLAAYINHFVRARRGTDLETLHALLTGASGDACEVLERFGDNHAFDAEKILTTELHAAFQEYFMYPVTSVSG
jgi:hypothetical protein